MLATDEVYRLQRGNDPECLAFQAFADRAHYRREGSTRQGTYVVSPNGELLGSINTSDPRRVAAMLREALVAWDTLPDDRREVDGAVEFAPRHRWEDSLPADGMVLTVTMRDLVDGSPNAAPSASRNRDQAWFAADEARGWLPNDLDAATVGTRYAVPAALYRRLARFHFVDAVRGQTLPYHGSEIDGAIGGDVVAIDDSTVRVRFAGTSRATADGEWRLDDSIWTPRGRWPRGVVLALVGEATWDRDTARFTSFDLVARGQRWGRTRFNNRRGDPSVPGPIGFHVGLTDRDSAFARIAPAFAAIYGAKWLKRP